MLCGIVGAGVPSGIGGPRNGAAFGDAEERGTDRCRRIQEPWFGCFDAKARQNRLVVTARETIGRSPGAEALRVQNAQSIADSKNTAGRAVILRENKSGQTENFKL
jgi:hypothetical protein